MAVSIREAQLLPDEQIKEYAGRWVAIKDGNVIAAADDHKAVLEKLDREGKTADIVRKLPTEAESKVWIL